MTETLVIVIHAKGRPGSGKTHRLARAVLAVDEALELNEGDMQIFTPSGNLQDHIDHLVEVKAKDHLDPNAVQYAVEVFHNGT